MFDLNPAEPQQLFQDWNILHCVTRLFCGVSFFLVLAVSDLFDGNFAAAVTGIIVALGWSVFTFFLSHLPWHCVVKRSGFCGPGYILWGLVYLAGAIVVLQKWYHMLKVGRHVIQERVERIPVESELKFSATMALGPFLFGIADLFMFIACLKSSQQARARESEALQAPLLDS